MSRLRCCLALLVAGSITAPWADTNAGTHAEAPGAPSRDAYWSEARTESPGPASAPQAWVHPRYSRSFQVRLAELGALLQQAPRETRDVRGGIEITLPLPDGRLERFRAVESPIFSDDLARAFPDVHTYRARGIDRPTLAARLDLTAFGVRAIVFTPEGTALVDPIERGRTDAVLSYLAKDESAGPFECNVTEEYPTPALPAGPEVFASGDRMRTFRFILMATGEYTQALGGHAQAIAQMTTAMNRVDAIFEHESAVRLQVVQMMAFDDPTTDPYPTNNTGQLLGTNSAVVDSIFGTGTYDMTQVISITPGYEGRSFRPTQCFDGYTGQSSVTGPDPTSNLFVLKVMPHEIGHTLGATHTQDGGNNRFVGTAFEPGNGWTIMTSPGDAPSFDEPFFHAASLAQMDTTLGSPPGCETPTPTGDTPPTADAGPNYTIPRATPFVLTGSGADPDPDDTLTYCWEEIDTAPTKGDLTNGPLFRSRFPALSPARELPALATVLSGIADPLEKLPTVDRLLHFRLTTRDNHPGAGGHAWDDMTVTVSGAPFAVTSPNGGNTIDSSLPFTVTWTVGGGSGAANVDILLSTDEGASWIPLVSNTPNDGSEMLTYATTVTSTTCRIKVAADGNIFYDVSNADFTIVGGPTPAYLLLLEAEPTVEGILLRWQLTEPAYFGPVVVERSEAGQGPWSTLTGEPREEPEATTLLDSGVTPGSTYFYRLVAPALDGRTFTFGPISAQALVDRLPLAITRVAPNPSRGTFKIDYSVPRAARLRLRIFDVRGRLVATLRDGTAPPGRSQATWAGEGGLGRPPGLYFVRLDSDGASDVHRVVITQ